MLLSTLLVVACALLFSSAASSQAVHAQAASGEVKRLKHIRDMVVVSEGDEEVVYASDDHSGAIFYLRNKGVEPGPWKLSDFKLLVDTAPYHFTSPNGLAYRKGKLYVCDKDADAVFEVALGSGEHPKPVPLPLGGVLHKPEYIAVSENGVIAVGTDKAVQYFSPSATTDGVTIVEGTEDIDRLVFDGHTLIVLDAGGTGELYRFDVESNSRPMRSAAEYPKVLPDEIRSQLRGIDDFASYRGIYYVVGHDRIETFARSQLSVGPGPQLLPVPLPKDPAAKISRIALSESRIYILGGDEKRLLSVARPAPILIDFPRASAVSAADQQSKIYEALYSKGTLLHRTVLANNAYDDINIFVKDELFPELQKAQTTAANNDYRQSVSQSAAQTTQARNSVSQSVSQQTTQSPVSPPAQINEILSRTSLLVCKLNGWDCQERQTRGAKQVFKTSGNISLKDEVIVPLTTVKGYYADAPLTAVTRNDLETYLAERDIIPLTDQISPLTPGDLVRLEETQQGTPRKLGRCNTELSNAVMSKPTLFPDEMTMDADDFAHQIGTQISGRDLERLGITKVAVKYADVQYDRLNLSVWEKSRACSSDASKSSTYIVDKVLWASSAYFKFLDSNGKLVTPGAKALAMLSLSGQADPSRQWSWTVQARLNLGYAAFRFKSDLVQRTLGVSYLEPFTPTARKVYSQQLTMLVESAKIQGVLQELNNPTAGNLAKLYAFTAQDQVTASKEYSYSTNATPSASDRDLTLDDAIAERNKLNELIHFSKEMSDLDLGEVKIGIVEDSDTIQKDHQCFYDKNGDWAWVVPDEDATVTAPSDPSEDPVPGPVKNADQFDKPDREHGTHVAAIIGARRLLRGLMPTIKLVLIDTKQLTTEISANVPIYNFSTKPPVMPEGYDNFLKRVKDPDRMGDPLFVVAAGNEGVNYSDVTPPIPVSWLDSIPNNMIVVGASTFTDPPSRLSVIRLGNTDAKGSNYSKKYVQLLAPGESIFSAAKRNSYAPASGTSQAAPQVTAVAALLSNKNYSARWIKAALIYTADWREDIMDEVWGGFLNAQRAYLSTLDNPNSIWFSDQEPPVFVTPVKTPYRIKIKAGAFINDTIHSKDALDPLSADLLIAFDDILRVQNMKGGLFRVIYLDNKGEMKMLVKAKMEGGIRCTVAKDADGKPVSGDVCARFAEGKPTGEIGFERIEDYIRKVPVKRFIKF